MQKLINKITDEFLTLSENKPIRLISHHDTDGITSAAILTKTFQRLERKFSVRIIKGIDEEIIEEEMRRNENEIIVFSDLGSGNLHHFQNLKNPIFILDHHEIDKTQLNDKIKIINPHLVEGSDDICGAAVCYLFSKKISPKNKDLAKLGIIGMIGDRHERNISKTYQEIINDSEGLEIKKSLLIFSATRPLRRSLFYSTSCYIPGVTASTTGVREILRENNISPERTLHELNDDEVSRLVTSVMVRRAGKRNEDEIIGNVYLLKFFNRKEDVRELSTLINSCSRQGHYSTAIFFCLENATAKKEAEDLYIQYKQELVSGLKIVEKIEKQKGDGFVILNAKGTIKDALIGTICSMISSSPDYEEGTILIGMAYNKDKIKVSARIAGQGGKNLREVMESAVIDLDAEVGGHNMAAGCLIRKEDEEKFVQSLTKHLQIEIVKV
ncbi:DHH family phosphoesterase [archaeon]|nr:DHH family phosphoesterase [archaeon]